MQPLTLRQVQPAEVDTSPNPGLPIVSALAAVESEAKKEVVQVNIENLNIFNIDRDGKEKSVQDKAKNNARAAPKAEEDAAVQALMLEKVNEALVIDQQANAANNEVDNVLRAMAMSQKEQDKSTVILVVTKIEIKVEVNIDLDDDKNGKKKVDASMFMQEAVVANRGKAETETVMGMYNVLGDNFANKGHSVQPPYFNSRRCRCWIGSDTYRRRRRKETC